jgi:hypothetical protein
MYAHTYLAAGKKPLTCLEPIMLEVINARKIEGNLNY